jgi:hypothetical protein
VSEELDGTRPTQELDMRSNGRLGAAMLLACLSCIAGCSPDSGPSSTQGPPPSGIQVAATGSETLAPGVVARVGAFDIFAERLALVVQAQQVSPKEACEMEIRDALFANGALARTLFDMPGVAAALRGRLARAVLSKQAQETSVLAPTDDEVREATARHFVDLDRPEAFKVIHAVVRVASGADAATKTRAREVAETIKRQVSQVKDPAEFRSRAEAVEHGGFELVVEELKPVAADGRVIDLENPPNQGGRSGSYEVPFAVAASRLGQPGDKSDPIETEYGWHVLMLVQRQAAHSVPFEERRRMLRDEIVASRAKRSVEALRNELRNRLKPIIERSADAVLVEVGMPRQ